MGKWILLFIVIASLLVLVRQRSLPSSVTILFPTPTPTVTPMPTLPPQKILSNNYHIFQSFNNCGPASFSMLLSYFDIHESQETLGQMLRPYQVKNGDNDDKSVTIDEIAKLTSHYGLVAFHRPAGSIQLLKLLVTMDIPVLTRTWLRVNDDIGHYRIVKGYDDGTQTIIQDDSYQGKNISYTYNDFNQMWEKFNYEFLIITPPNKAKEIQHILGPLSDENQAWNIALKRAQALYQKDQTNIWAAWNISVAAYHTQNYTLSTNMYEKIQDKLPFRTLWYQTEPLDAYMALQSYDTVLAITQNILSNQNRAYAELYIMRGKIYSYRGERARAKDEFTKAVRFNIRLEEAQELLAQLEHV